MNLHELSLLSCSFNNTLLTGMMIKSFYKQTGGIHPHNVIIIDNGDSIAVDDDTKRVFDVVDNFNHKLLSDELQPSRNHCIAVDYALKNKVHTKWCLLVDNDILFYPSVLQFLQEFDESSYDAAGEIGWDYTPPDRLYPYFCLINVEKFNAESLNYFDRTRIICKGMPGKEGKEYNVQDTGYSFYEDIKNTWRILNFNIKTVCLHMKGAMLKHKNVYAWLKANESLYD